MKPDSYMPLYGNEFFSAVEGYSDSVIVGYIKALWKYWHHFHCEGLPDDDEYLRKVCCCEPHNWVRTKGVIFDNDRFFRLDNGKWHQKRQLEEWTKSISAYQKRLVISKLGVEARTQPTVKPTVEPTVKPTVNQLEQEQEQELKLEKEREQFSGGSGGNQVEPPVGFPATEEEAKAHSGFVGCTPDFAAKTWAKAMSRSGYDAKGQPIRKFPYYLKTEWTYEQERQAKEKAKPEQPSAPMDKFLCSQELKRVEDEIQAVRNTATVDAMGTRKLTTGQREKLAKLKGRQSELKAQLGFTA